VDFVVYLRELRKCFTLPVKTQELWVLKIEGGK